MGLCHLIIRNISGLHGIFVRLERLHNALDLDPPRLLVRGCRSRRLAGQLEGDEDVRPFGGGKSVGKFGDGPGMDVRMQSQEAVKSLIRTGRTYRRGNARTFRVFRE